MYRASRSQIDYTIDRELLAQRVLKPSIYLLAIVPRFWKVMSLISAKKAEPIFRIVKLPRRQRRFDIRPALRSIGAFAADDQQRPRRDQGHHFLIVMMTLRRLD